jgi:hypothetical protein
MYICASISIYAFIDMEYPIMMYILFIYKSQYGGKSRESCRCKNRKTKEIRKEMGKNLNFSTYWTKDLFL